MYNAIDTFRQDLHVGDLITYTTRRSSSMYTYPAIITEIVDNGGTYRNRFSLKVKTYDQYANYDGENHKYIPGTRKATLTSNETIVRISRDSLPVGISEALLLT